MQKGSILGSTLLIAGSCIGAGMLGIPVSTAQAGFLPSVVMFFLSWLFMMTTGFLLVEVNFYFKKNVNLITMAEKTLGSFGKIAAWFLYLFLFYCVMVAYTSGSGELLSDFFYEVTSIKISNSLSSVLFVLVFGFFIYFGTFAVDRVNRVLMLGLIITFLMLFFLGLPHIETKFLKKISWDESFWAIPIMIVSFGFHNLVPSLMSYMNYDLRKMQLSIVLGSAIPFISYLLWQFLILGLIPAESFLSPMSASSMVTSTLKKVVEDSWVVDIAQLFAFFAIVTSFIGVALSFVDFISDGFKLGKSRSEKLVACCFVLLPPLIFALIYPSLFVNALKFAGGFGTVLLFGVLPVMMVWSGRYVQKLWKEKLVFGGKLTLIIVMMVSISVFIMQLINSLFFDK